MQQSKQIVKEGVRKGMGVPLATEMSPTFYSNMNMGSPA